MVLWATIAPPRSSHINAKPNPLCNPNGRSEPRGVSKKVFGSVVDSPSWSMSAPSGTWLPQLYATRTLPAAITLVAISRTMGSFPSRGTAQQNGLVCNLDSNPPNGDTIGKCPTTLTKWIETRFADAHCSPYVPIRPMWCALRSPTLARPSSFALRIAMSVASFATTWPNPLCPSCSCTILAWAETCRLFLFIPWTYEGIIPTPCESWPFRLASTKWSAVI